MHDDDQAAQKDGPFGKNIKRMAFISKDQISGLSNVLCSTCVTDEILGKARILLKGEKHEAEQ